MKADVEDNSIHPPSTGWKFDNNQNFVGWQFDNKFDKRRDFDEVIKMGDFQEDPSVTCSFPPASSPCSVTLRLIGLAKDFQGKCEGEYKDTGLRSFGRQLTFRSIKSFSHFNQLIGVQTGGPP